MSYSNIKSQLQTIQWIIINLIIKLVLIMLDQSSTPILTKTIYMIHQAQIFNQKSLQQFNLYKHFVQSTIMQLGEDWRIQSGILAQQIVAQKKIQSEFCIFNQFMAVFLLQKIGHQHTQQFDNPEKGQELFLKYFQEKFDYQQNWENTQINFNNNLAFKTLSLGFYITASDVWIKTFNRLLKDQTKNNKISNKNDKYHYFGTLFQSQYKNESKWLKQKEQSQDIIKFYQMNINQLDKNILGIEQALSKSIKLGFILVNIQQINICGINYRVISLSKQYYLLLFSIWLIFSIKKSFNSNTFTSSIYQRYCKLIIKDQFQKYQNNIKQNMTQEIVENLQCQFYQSIYKSFKILCDQQWKNIMKDYMVVLNDDKQIIRKLINNIAQEMQTKFLTSITDKSSNFQKL